MSFTPCNRYLLVVRQENQAEEETLIALPEGTFRTDSRYERVTVEGISSEVRPPLAVGKDLVVLSHMIEEVDFGDGPVYLVLENHVLGIVE
ncbi:MAG: hypothetical protein ACR2M6_01545 [Vampirovibrionia bacterium]|jgi:hypothetical protein